MMLSKVKYGIYDVMLMSEAFYEAYKPIVTQDNGESALFIAEDAT